MQLLRRAADADLAAGMPETPDHPWRATSALGAPAVSRLLPPIPASPRPGPGNPAAPTATAVLAWHYSIPPCPGRPPPRVLPRRRLRARSIRQLDPFNSSRLQNASASAQPPPRPTHRPSPRVSARTVSAREQESAPAFRIQSARGAPFTPRRVSAGYRSQHHLPSTACTGQVAHARCRRKVRKPDRIVLTQPCRLW